MINYWQIKKIKISATEAINLQFTGRGEINVLFRKKSKILISKILCIILGVLLFTLLPICDRENVVLRSNIWNWVFCEVTLLVTLNLKKKFLAVCLCVCMCLYYQHNWKTNNSRKFKHGIVNMHYKVLETFWEKLVL